MLPEGSKGVNGVSKAQRAARVNDVMGFLGGALLILSLEPVADLVALPEDLVPALMFAGVYLTCVAVMVTLMSESNEKGRSSKG